MHTPLLSALAAGLALLALLALSSACTPSQPGNNHLDHSTLQRSAAYTQRHLLELKHHQSRPPTQRPSQREALLSYSQCDLIERGLVKAEVKPAFCTLPEPDIEPSTRYCMSQFHRCLGECNAIKGYCNSCEQQGISCLGLQ